jgi:hypothetical protein
MVWRANDTGRLHELKNGEFPERKQRVIEELSKKIKRVSVDCPEKSQGVHCICWETNSITIK